MFFLDELQDYRLYRRNILLPIDEKNKRKNCAAFILSPTDNGLSSVLNNSLLLPRYYNSYYMERAVLYYVNQEGTTDVLSDEYITEDAQLDEPKDIHLRFSGYSHNISEVKKYLKQSWFENTCKEYKINYKKIDTCIVIIQDDTKNTTGRSIYLKPITSYPRSFDNYECYCKFNALMWLFYKANPNMYDWLCMGAALRECGTSLKYDKWPYHHNLRLICKGIDEYEKTNGRLSLINDVYKSNGGINKLNVSILDLLCMLSDDLQKELAPLILGEGTIPLSDYIGIITEDTKYNSYFKKILFKDRIRSTKELKALYEEIKEEFPQIKYTYNDLSMYKNLNLFIDLSHYNKSFFANCTFKNVKGAELYIDLLIRLFNDKRITNAGYNTQTIIIPLDQWKSMIEPVQDSHFINKQISPISCIFWMMSGANISKLKEVFGNREVLFLGKSSFMKINFSKSQPNKQFFLRNIRALLNNEPVIDLDAKVGATTKSSARAIKADLISSIEKSSGSKIDNISTDDEDITSKEDQLKKELVKDIDKISKGKNNTQDALQSIDANEEEAKKIKQILSDLSTNPDNGSNISGARASRMLKLQQDFLDSKFQGKTVGEIINSTEIEADTKVKPVKIDVDSINPEWENLQFAANLESYDLDQDLVRIFGAFYNTSNPLVVQDISIENTSNSNDLIYTYTCKYESALGKRYTIKLDIPKFIDNKYMKLRGNRKNIPIQLFLMPIIKTEENAVQIVSCYNKIFIRRFGTTSGKSNVCTDKLIKTLKKHEFKGLSYKIGDNSKVCSKYELPIDYIDIASEFSSITTSNAIYIFNQDELRKKFEVDDSKGLCCGYIKESKNLIYYKPDPDTPIFFSQYLYWLIEADLKGTIRDDFISKFKEASTSVRYTYSRASVLGTQIPLVVVCALAEGLESTMRKAKIKYDFSEKRPKFDSATQDIIKFKDGYIIYDLNYSSSLLMNGLKHCNTEDYSILEINSRVMYLDFLDMFGGRIKADGLDNFRDCMIDPITRETLSHYKLPVDYVSVLLYANLLLSDNKFIKHGDIKASRRFRRMEQVASYTYEVLSKAYGAYSTGLKHGRDISFSVKQSAVIDRLLIGNTTDDQSILNALGEYEAYYAVTPKGPSGMNSDRAYSLDKRSFDDSMLNVLSASTGFAGTVGITRQATIDAPIDGARGYIYNDTDIKDNEINSVKTLCMTEALCPYSSTRDDPMRLAMGFIQTQKHGMRCDHSDPLLITSGADEALPYLISNTFAYKAKDKGEVIELTDDYMIIKYDKPIQTKDGKIITCDYVNLENEVQKNSSSGFYIGLKLDTDLKVGSKVKKNQIVAYDKQSFSDEMGSNDNIAYNIGTLAKIAIFSTDEGFEDSAIISNDMSEALASDVVLEKIITVSKDANVYNLVKKGSSITEGDTLCIIQNAYEDEDVNRLLKNLNGEEDEITNLGRVPVTSKVTGYVEDIVVQRTVEISECSSTLQKIIKGYENEINVKKKVMSKYGIDDESKTLPDIGILPAIGTLKNAADSVQIKIYLSYHDKFSVGCKMIYGTAIKGVDKDIFPVGKEPYSECRPNEKIHTLLCSEGIDARMACSGLFTTGINKFLIELSRAVKDMAGIEYDNNLLG